MSSPQSSAKRLEVSIIIPTMNEKENMKWFMQRMKPEWYQELVIMDGGSQDGTMEYCKEQGWPVYRQSTIGMPEAYNEGFERSTKDIVIILSPDGNSIPELIPVLADEIRAGADVAVASRYKGDAKSEDDDFFTRPGNWLFTTFLNVLFRTNYSDSLVMYRAYRREAVQRMGLHIQWKENWLRRKYSLINSWELGSLIRAKKLGLKVVDIPGDEPKRVFGQRKLMIPVHASMALYQILEEFFRGRKYLKRYEKTASPPPLAPAESPR